jgi:hypothetical protein
MKPWTETDGTCAGHYRGADEWYDRPTVTGAAKEAGHMQRALGILFVATVLLASVGTTGIIIWQTEAGNISMRSVRYGIGALLIVVGVCFTVLQLAVNDDYLARHFGEASVGRMRQMWRGGWVGVLLGAAMIAAAYWL